MFILKVLGGASLEGPDGPLTGRAAQRRRLAALSLLAMSRRSALGREKLVAILWPESDGERGRHLLSDTVYVINRALGGEVITSVADELRLNAERVACDARAFEDASERGAFEEAVRLYAGPFLDGFFLDGSEEFERWAATERVRLHDLFERSLEQLADARAAAGDARGAVECWRKLESDDPLNSRIACQLARALDRAGDRAGAVQQLQSHAAVLKRELGVPPPEDVVTLARALRTAPVAAPVRATVIAEESSAAIPDPPARPMGRRRRAELIAAAVAVALALIATRVFWPRATSAVTPTSLQSVAVLPFKDLSPSRDHEYFSDGIAEELSTRLARVAGLKVAARTSAFAFKGTDADARAIGRALNVEALLEGSVRQSEGHVRIAVQLVDARNGYQIWANTWDRAGHDVLALQDEIASGVLRALRSEEPVNAPPAVATSRAIDPAAYDLYLKGRYFWHQRTRDSLTQAASAFERAVSLAPAYAEAHSGLADAYAVLGFYDYLPPRDAFPRAKAAATRALVLDDRLAHAHASLGYVALYYDWTWTDAERSLRRAIELNPNYSVGHQWLGNYLVARGRFDEAVASMRRAQEVDPLSLIASAALGWVHYYRRDFDGAVEQCRRTIELNDKFEQAWLWSGWAHEAAGRYDDARKALNRAASLSGSAVGLASLGRVEALSGRRRAADDVLSSLRAKHGSYLPAYEMAKLHLALGQRADALTWLQRAFDQRSHSMVLLAVDPQLDPLRSDAAFADLLIKTGVSVR